jgi:lipopolysaccharide/colanic/teichoic acid biosynthesis glycosyltransferase
LFGRAGRFVGGIYSAGGRGVTVATAGVAIAALLVAINAFLDLHGLLGFLTAILIIVVVGRAEREIHRAVRVRQLRRAALIRRDHPETSLDPVKDVGVRPWLGGGPSGELSPFVERRAIRALRAGLRDNRFAIMVGPQMSGKSRLAYEAAVRWSHVTLIAQPLPLRGDDPLMDLMDDSQGFPSVENDQILLLTDFDKRVRNGWINAQQIKRCLEQNPRIAIIAVLDSEERDKMVAAGTPVQNDWSDLKEAAKIVEVRARLNGSELREAAEKYGYIHEEKRPYLTRYLASGPPLREALENMSSGVNLVGCSIVAAVADWFRAGVERPAPLNFVLQVVRRFHDDMDQEQFDEELAWALEERVENAALIYRREGEDGIGEGFVPDPVVIEIFDHGDGKRLVPSHTWEIVGYCVRHRIGVAELGEGRVGHELRALGEAALRRGNEDFAYRVLEDAARISDFGQRQQIGEAVLTDRDSALASSRRGDGLFMRLKSVKALADGRRFEAGSPKLGIAERSEKGALAWIYQRHSLRSFARVFVLGLADLLSTGLGLLAGQLLRAALTDAGAPFASGGSVSGSFLGLWAAVTLFVFSSARLYRKDAARVRIGSMIGAVALVGLFGWIAMVADGTGLFDAAVAALGGVLAALLADVLFRASYDWVSRRWVVKHGLEARTLLIGAPELVATVERALRGMSRPSIVVGYLADSSESEDGPRSQRLGSVDELAGIAQRLGVGRVIFADPDLDPTERLRLADRCHERGILVEARASLVDIRSGSATFVLGRPLVLVRLLPLWQRNIWFFVKRAVDIGVSAAALLLLGIPLVLIWIGVLLQGRPGIVRTLRAGLGGEAFYMLRFRTAQGETGARIDLIEDGGQEELERTRFGSFLRKHGIDEIPQLINILRGQMSLVGPRPLELRHHVLLSDAELQRYVVRPGATGPWQVCSQTALTYSELTSIDLAYLRKWSLLSDLEILARTVWLVLTRRELPRLVDEAGKSMPD